MTTYLLIWIFSSSISLINRRGFIAALVLFFFVAFRWDVGTDWSNYVERSRLFGEMPLSDLIGQLDFGYKILEHLGWKFGVGLLFPNFISALILTESFRRLMVSSNFPYGFLILSIPYLFFVVGMGYPRQAMAIGAFIFLVLADSNWKKYFWVLVGISTHYSFIFPLIFFHRKYFNNGAQNYYLIFLASLVCLFFYGETIFALFQEEIFTRYFIGDGLQSKGFYIRVFFLLPSMLILVLHGKFKAEIFYVLLLFFMALSLPFLTTLTDRLLLYVYPLLIIEFKVIIRFASRTLGYMYMWFHSLLFFLVWFMFSVYRADWIPYNTILW